MTVYTDNWHFVQFKQYVDICLVAQKGLHMKMPYQCKITSTQKIYSAALTYKLH